MEYDDFNDAIIAAHNQAKKDGYAFAVQWPLGHSTVEARKPSLRNQRMRVIECREDGSDGAEDSSNKHELGHGATEAEAVLDFIGRLMS